MRLGTRIFFCYLIIFIICFSYPINWVLDNLRNRYLEGVEEPLVDHANILAAMVAGDMEANQFDPEKWYQAFETACSRSLSARIYNLVKSDVDMRIYITDATGKIIFDSKNKQNVGSDYSNWRDVHLTLKGKYGARFTAEDSEDPTSKVLYVAAPLRVNGNIAGVLTVAKPTTSINNFLKNAKPQIFKVGVLAAGLAILLSYFVSRWITRPIQRLTRYANDISQGKRAAFPKLDHSEIGEMGQAFAKMQETLEGKKYVEQYVQKLTHEVKSPLSAIRGAAELLEEKMPPEQRARFLSNIRHEANRIQKIVDRMLELSALENQKILTKKELISAASLIKNALESKRAILSKKQLHLELQVPDHIILHGDSLLLHQALANLIQNAIDFSPANSQIKLLGQVADRMLNIIVEDSGSGIPDFAMTKVFDKFFSLQRPDSGEKSTGLGLNFVKEVAILHNGDVILQKRAEGGVRATLMLPL
ncbi:MAG: two-component system sensor histidine kinase CreC [Desulfobacterales bacterium]|nr:MAG: two-component system sensor histidine kinase CreC [Desulfobacterales bacterium]